MTHRGPKIPSMTVTPDSLPGQAKVVKDTIDSQLAYLVLRPPMRHGSSRLGEADGV